VRYDIVNATSEFYRDRVFRQALSARQFLIAGYPRNTFGCQHGIVNPLAWKNTDQRVAACLATWHRQERHIILVAPTFRDSGSLPMNLSTDTIKLLENWCRDNRAELVFKFHPVENTTLLQTGHHLHVCDPDSDLYPLMPHSSALITDYSSIYMDYLLLDKPVLFFVPDLDEYVRKNRQLQFDFDEMTPGPKLRSWPDLIRALSDQMQHDRFAAARLKLKALAFDDQDQNQAVPKLIETMQSKHWIPDTNTGTRP
jgi:CDP-glycerol glycerophosphotransferase (TagB/SpsB family)